MSAPLQLTPNQMRDVAEALDAITEIRNVHGVAISGYSQAEVRHIAANVVLSLAWDDEVGYTIDDRSGS